LLRQEINASLVEVQGRRGAVLRERAGRVKGAYRERSERTLDATKRGVPNAYGAVGVESLPQSDAPERRLTWADITVLACCQSARLARGRGLADRRLIRAATRCSLAEAETNCSETLAGSLTATKYSAG